MTSKTILAYNYLKRNVSDCDSKNWEFKLEGNFITCFFIEDLSKLKTSNFYCEIRLIESKFLELPIAFQIDYYDEHFYRLFQVLYDVEQVLGVLGRIKKNEKKLGKFLQNKLICEMPLVH